MYRTSLFFITLLLSFLVVACDDGGGNAAFNTNVINIPGDDSRLASELTPAEAIEFCELSVGLQLAIMGDGTMLCASQGLKREQDGLINCEEHAEQCAANTVVPIPDDDVCLEIIDDLVDCSATVGELEDCLNEGFQLMEEIAEVHKAVTCDSDPSVLAELEAMAEEFENGRDCMDEIEAKCPNF